VKSDLRERAQAKLGEKGMKFLTEKTLPLTNSIRTMENMWAKRSFFIKQKSKSHQRRLDTKGNWQDSKI